MVARHAAHQAGRRAGRDAEAGIRIVGYRRCSRHALLQATALRATALAVLAGPAAAQIAPGAHPMGGTITGGAAGIAQSGSTTTISQTSQNAAIDWQSFNVGSQQKVVFAQPNSGAIALNTVVGPNPSEIAGQIAANGQVVIVNQSGVLFDHGAQVDTAGLVVSASGISRSNFMAGHMVFDQAPHAGARIVNNGTITIQQAGLAALVAPQVTHNGLISARLGRVILGGAETFTLDLYGDGLLALNVTGQVTQATANGRTVTALVTNTGTILADGGTVVLSAVAADGLIRTLVDAGGTIAAHSVGAQTARVLVEGVGGSVQVDGDISVAGQDPGTHGGQVSVTATGSVAIAAGATIDASGDGGGGMLAIGTPATGAALQAQSVAAAAQATSVAAGAVLRADATGAGNGGQVSVYSRGALTHAGSISAQGAAGGHGGSIQLAASGSVTVSGSSNAGADGSITIAAEGPDSLLVVTQSLINALNAGVAVLAGGDISIAPGGISLDRKNGPLSFTSITIDALGTLTVNNPIEADGAKGVRPGTLVLEGNGGILLESNVLAGGTALSLLSGGAIVQSSGSITATSLTGSAQSASLDGGQNVLAKLGDFTASGGFTLVDSKPLVVNGTVTAGTGSASTLALSAPTLTLTGAGSLLSPLGTIALAADRFSLGGTISTDGSGGPAGLVGLSVLTNGGTLAFAGSSASRLSTGTLVLGSLDDGVTSRAGAITIASALDLTGHANALGLFTENSGSVATGHITVGTLVGSTGTVNFGPVSSIGTLGDFTVHEGDFTLADAGTLSVSGTVASTSGGVTLSAAGLTALGGSDLSAGGGNVSLVSSLGLTLGGTISTPKTGTVNLAANDGGITESGGITAGSLGGSARGSGTGQILLTGDNDVGTLTGLAALANLAFDDAGSALQVTGAVTSASGNITLLAQSLSLQAAIGAPGQTVTLRATQGGITEAGGSVQAGTLSGSAAGGVTLSAANTVATLGNFAAGGGFALADSQALTVNGTVSAAGGGTLALTAPGLTVTTGTLLSPGGVIALVADSFTLGGTVDTDATAGTLSGFIGLARLSGGGTFSLATADLAGLLTGTLSLGSVTGLPGSSTASAITLNGPFDLTGHALTLGLFTAASGQVTADGITAAALTGDTGSAVLGGTNAIGVLDGFQARSGALSFTDTGSLSLNGVIAGSTGVTLSADGIGQAGGTVTAGSGVIDLTSTAGIALSGTLLAMGSGGAVALDAQGGISEAGGAIDTTSLSGSAQGGAATLSGTNAVGTLSGFTASNGFSLDDGNASLVVGGPVSATAGGLALSAGTLSIGGTLSALAGTIALTATQGGIHEQPGGLLHAAGLTGSSAGAVVLTGANSLTTLGSFTAAGFALTDSQALSVAGTVTSTSGTLALTTPTLTVQGGGELLGAGGGTVALTADTFDLYGSVSTGGTTGIVGLTLLTPGGTLSVAAGDLTSFTTGTLSLGSLDGVTPSSTVAAINIADPLSLTGIGGLGLFTSATGTVTTNGLTVGALTGDTGSAMLLGHNQIGALNGFRTRTGAFTLNDSGSLTIAGLVSGATGVSVSAGAIKQTGTMQALSGDLALSAPGGVTFAGLLQAAGGTVTLSAAAGSIEEAANGRLVAGSLAGTAGVEAKFGVSSGNTVGTLGVFTVAGSGAFILEDDVAPTIDGPLNAGSIDIFGPASGGIAGNLILNGDVTAQQPIVLESAGGIVQLGGTVKASSVTLTALGGIIQLSGDAAGPSAIVATAGDVRLTGNGTTTYGSQTVSGIAFAGTLSAQAGTAGLFATNILENATGNLMADTLTGTASAGSALLAAASGNSVGTLSGFAVARDFTLEDDSAPTISGLFAAPGGSIDVYGPNGQGSAGQLTLSGTVTALDSISFDIAGGIDQTGGSVRAGTNLSLTSGGALDFAGTLAAQTGTATLAAGSIVEAAGGQLLAASLTGSATTGGAAFAAASGNRVGTLAGFASMGSFTLEDDVSPTVIGTFASNGSIDLHGANLGGSTGTLVLDGVITAKGDASFDSAAAIDQTGGSVSAGGNLALVAGQGIDFAGTLQAQSGTATLDAAGNIAEATSGRLLASTLTGTASAGGSALFTAASGNRVGTLSGFVVASDFTLEDDIAPTISGLFSAPGGAIDIYGPDGAGSAGTLMLGGTVTALTDISLTIAGGIDQTGGAVTAGGNLLLSAGDGIAFAGTLSALAGTATLSSSAGGIAEDGGTLLARVLTGSAGGNGSAQFTTSAGNSVTMLAAFSTGGDFTLEDDVAPNVSGPLVSGASIDLHGPNGGGSAGVLLLGGPVSAAADISIDSAGAIDQTAGRVVAGRDLLLKSGAGIQFAGTLSAQTGTATFDSLINTVEAGSGRLLAHTLSGSVAKGSALFTATSGNTVSTLSAFSVSDNFTLEDDIAPTITGMFSAPGGAIDIHGPNGRGSAGTLALNGTITALTNISFDIAGSIDQTGGLVRAGADLLLTAGDGIAFGGTLTALSGTATLDTAGSIAEAVSGRLVAATLAGNAAGSASFTARNNAVGTLVGFSTGTAFTLDDGVTLVLAGPVTAGTDATLVSQGAIQQAAGTVQAGGALSLAADQGIAFDGTLAAQSGTASLASAGGSITEGASGRLLASTLTGAAGGSVALDVASGNVVGTLAGFSAAGGFTLEDDIAPSITGTLRSGAGIDVHGPDGGASAGTLVLAGLVTASSNISFDVGGAIDQTGGAVQAGGNLSLSAGAGIAFDGTLSAQSGTAALNAAGDITEGAAGRLLANTLTGSATAGGSAVFAAASGNQVGTLAGFTTGAAFSLNDGVSLVLAGPVTAGTSASFGSAGAINQTGSAVQAGSSLSLVAGTGIAFAGTLSAPAGLATLDTAAGDVTETAGASLVAGTLTGSAPAGSITLAAPVANAIGTLSNLVAGGSFTLDDATTLVLDGAVGVGATASLASAGAIDQVSGTLQAAHLALTGEAGIAFAGTLQASDAALVSGAGIAEASSGALLADVLTGSAVGVASLAGGGNAVAALGQFYAPAFTLADTGDLLVAGPVVASTVALSAANIGIPGSILARSSLVLNATGAIDAPGIVMAATLSGSAGGSASFLGSNTIAQLGAFSAGGGFSLTDATTLGVAGQVSGGPSVSIAAAGGLFVAGGLQGLATVLQAAEIDIPGSILASTLALDATAGGIVENGSLQVSAALSGSAAGSAAFGGNNSIAGLAGFTASQFTLRDTSNLTVSGPVSAAAGVGIADTAALTLSGAVSAAAGNVTLSGGQIAFNGAVNALGDIIGVSLGNITMAGTGSLVTSPGGAAGAILLRAPGTMTIGGTLGARTILLGSPSGEGGRPQQVTLDNDRIDVGSSVPPHAFDPAFPASDGTVGGSPAGLFVYAASIQQVGATTINGSGAPGTASFTLAPGGGSIVFATSPGLVGPSTELFLSVGSGTVTGAIDVAGLNVLYTPPGSSQPSYLQGTIDGVGGEAAAAAARILPLGSNNFRINSCPISSANCLLLSPILIPVTDPVDDVVVALPSRQREDDDLIIPNVGEQDF